MSKGLVNGCAQIASDHASKESISGRLHLLDQIGLLPQMRVTGIGTHHPLEPLSWSIRERALSCNT